MGLGVGAVSVGVWAGTDVSGWTGIRDDVGADYVLIGADRGLRVVRPRLPSRTLALFYRGWEGLGARAGRLRAGSNKSRRWRMISGIGMLICPDRCEGWGYWRRIAVAFLRQVDGQWH